MAQNVLRNLQTNKRVVPSALYTTRGSHLYLGEGMQSGFAISMLLLMLLLLSVPSINKSEHCAIAMHLARGVQTSFVISMLFPET
jgi:hypothetical protein